MLIYKLTKNSLVPVGFDFEKDDESKATKINNYVKSLPSLVFNEKYTPGPYPMLEYIKPVDFTREIINNLLPLPYIPRIKSPGFYKYIVPLMTQLLTETIFLSWKGVYKLSLGPIAISKYAWINVVPFVVKALATGGIRAIDFFFSICSVLVSWGLVAGKFIFSYYRRDLETKRVKRLFNERFDEIVKPDLFADILKMIKSTLDVIENQNGNYKMDELFTSFLDNTREIIGKSIDELEKSADDGAMFFNSLGLTPPLDLDPFEFLPKPIEYEKKKPSRALVPVQKEQRKYFTQRGKDGKFLQLEDKRAKNIVTYEKNPINVVKLRKLEMAVYKKIKRTKSKVGFVQEFVVNYIGKPIFDGVVEKFISLATRHFTGETPASDKNLAGLFRIVSYLLWKPVMNTIHGYLEKKEEKQTVIKLKRPKTVAITEGDHLQRAGIIVNNLGFFVNDLINDLKLSNYNKNSREVDVLFKIKVLLEHKKIIDKAVRVLAAEFSTNDYHPLLDTFPTPATKAQWVYEVTKILGNWHLLNIKY